MLNSKENNLYKVLCQKSKKHKYLYHYTNISSFKKIIKDRSLKLTRLSKVNDLYEDERITNLHKDKIYVACFTHRHYESVFMWKEYTDEDKGVIIRFNNFNNYDKIIYGMGDDCHYRFNKIKKSDLDHKSYDKVSDWGYLDITIADIEYTEDFCKYKYTDNQLRNIFNDTIIFENPNDNFIKHRYQALVKGIEWNNEEETRIRVALRPKGMENILNESSFIQPTPCFDNIFLKLSDPILNELKIIINPWANSNFKSQVKKSLASLKQGNYEIIDSNLKGTISKNYKLVKLR